MTSQTKQDKLLMHPRRSEVAEIAQYLVEMGEAEEGQDGWYITFDHKINQLLELINSEVLSVLEELEKKSIHYTSDGLVADALDPWATSVDTIQSIKNRYRL